MNRFRLKLVTLGCALAAVIAWVVGDVGFIHPSQDEINYVLAEQKVEADVVRDKAVSDGDALMAESQDAQLANPDMPGIFRKAIHAQLGPPWNTSLDESRAANLQLLAIASQNNRLSLGHDFLLARNISAGACLIFAVIFFVTGQSKKDGKQDDAVS